VFIFHRSVFGGCSGCDWGSDLAVIVFAAVAVRLWYIFIICIGEI